MTRTEVKQRQAELFPGVHIDEAVDYHGPDPMLPEICLAFREALNGSADPWSDDEVQATLQLLRDVLATWKLTTCEDDIEMNRAVWRLVRATIRYAESRIERQKGQP